MNGVDYSQKFNRQSEIYRKNLDDARRNYDEQVDTLKKTHESRQTTQSAEHRKQAERLEKDYQQNVNRVSEDQRKALVEKSNQYEKSINQNKEQFHAERKDNLLAWNKKFGELKEDFRKNVDDTKTSDQALRENMKKNYDENIVDIRKTADKDLKDYIANSTTDKKATDVQSRIEKNKLIDSHQKEMTDLVQRESGKRHLLFNDGIKEVREFREGQAKNYIENKNRAEANFQKQLQYTDDKIATEIEQREARTRERQAIDNDRQNKQFSEKYQELSKNYDKDIREMQYRSRAEKISQSDVNKAIRAKYEKSQKDQYQQKVDTHLKERQFVENKFQDRLQDTVDSYQNSMRENNIEIGEKISNLNAESTEANRQQKFLDSLEKEQLIHTNRVALKYERDKGTETAADLQKQNRKKVRNLKESFNRSLASAQEKSRKSFEDTKAEMLQDKRTLEKRLHEQNSKQSLSLRESYSDKMEKTINGYEKKIDALELQNKMIVQNANDMLHDVKRKTSAEIERQKKISKNTIEAEVKTQKTMAKEKEASLLKKIDRMQTDFTKKMNEQTIKSRNKLKDIQFELSQKMVSESNRYQDIIDQNNKFFAREIQRLQMAKSTERDRLIQQYEERIEQLQSVYKSKNEDMGKFNQLNNNNTAES